MDETKHVKNPHHGSPELCERAAHCPDNFLANAIFSCGRLRSWKFKCERKKLWAKNELLIEFIKVLYEGGDRFQEIGARFKVIPWIYLVFKQNLANFCEQVFLAENFAWKGAAGLLEYIGTSCWCSISLKFPKILEIYGTDDLIKLLTFFYLKL